MSKIFPRQIKSTRKCMKCGLNSDSYTEVKTKKETFEDDNSKLILRKTFYLCDDCVKVIQASFVGEYL